MSSTLVEDNMSLGGTHSSNAATGNQTQQHLTESDSRAIQLFEEAIEMEGHGKMADAVEKYRSAFRLNDHVDLLYRSEKVPHNIQKLKQKHGKNTARRVDEQMLKDIDVDKLIESYEHLEPQAFDPTNPSHIHEGITIKFSNLGLDNHEEVADVKPVSPLLHMSPIIWEQILTNLLLSDPQAWFNFSITCRFNAHLGFGNKAIWRKLCHLVYTTQTYQENVEYVRSLGLEDRLQLQDSDLPIPQNQHQIVTQYNNSWKYMLRNRPFIKFNGCYISVVNYYLEGGKGEFSSAWSNPVRTITYFRYLRFYPDGTCIKVLSVEDPKIVVPLLLKHNELGHIASTADSVTKDNQKIYHGTWTISSTGDVQIEITNGSVKYYRFFYQLQVKPLGGIYKHNKLTWVNYYAVRKKMSENDDREGEVTTFSLKKEKPFKFLRVRSYTPYN